MVRSEASAVLVAVRVRPPLRGEDILECPSISVSSDQQTVTLSESAAAAGVGMLQSLAPYATTSVSVVRHQFTFDRVFISSSNSPSLRGSSEENDITSPCASRTPVTERPNSQAAVYAFLGPIIIKHVVDGFNACLFAYGQTGSGKTYSMMGSTQPALGGCATDYPLLQRAPSVQSATEHGSTRSAPPCRLRDNEAGVIPRLCVSLFQCLEAEREANPSITHRVECSFIEIYCEKVRDLLRGGSGQTLRIRQHPTRGPFAEGAWVAAVTSADGVMQVVRQGMRERVTAETRMNDQSSRSHAILQIQVTRAELVRDAVSGAVLTKTKCSKVNLVDLAGSERVLQSGATGERLEEAKNINLSLHSLGRVIQMLAERSLSVGIAQGTAAQGAAGSATISTLTPSSSDPLAVTTSSTFPTAATGPVPAYRESSLTWLLSDSLGGNSKTVMLATVSPTASCYSQTLNTLRFACVAQKVVNMARVNEESNQQLVADLREQIVRLTVQLESQEALTEIKELRVRCEESEQTSARAFQTIREQATRIQSLEDAARVAQKMWTQQVDTLQLEIRRLMGEREHDDDELVALRTALRDAQRQLSSLSSQPSRSDDDALQAATGRIASLELEMAQLQQDYAALHQQKWEMGQEVQRLRSSLHTAEDVIKTLSRPTISISESSAGSVGTTAVAAPPVVTLCRTPSAATLQHAKNDDVEMQRLRCDVTELEQLLLEETETSQRHLLCGALGLHMAKLHEKCRQGIARLEQQSVRASSAAQLARSLHLHQLMLQESDARNRLIADAYVASSWGTELQSLLFERAKIRAAEWVRSEQEQWAAKLSRTNAELRTKHDENKYLQDSIERLHASRRAVVQSETERLSQENAKLCARTAESETTIAALRKDVEELQSQLVASEEALQQIKFGRAAEDDLLDNLRGAVSELEQENRFVHAANGDVAATYDAIVRRLREDNRHLRSELEDASSRHDAAIRNLSIQRAREREHFDDEMSHLEELCGELKRQLRHQHQQLSSSSLPTTALTPLTASEGNVSPTKRIGSRIL